MGDVDELWQHVTPLELWRARVGGFLLALTVMCTTSLSIAGIVAVLMARH